MTDEQAQLIDLFISNKLNLEHLDQVRVAVGIMRAAAIKLNIDYLNLSNALIELDERISHLESAK